MLDRNFAGFRKSTPEVQGKMIEKAADNIGNAWREDIEFDRDAMICVCELFAKLGYSHIQCF